MNLRAIARRLLVTPLVRWLGLLGLCAAYIQGGVQKALDVPAALAELAHFGLPAQPGLVVATVVVELGASLLILSGRQRWLITLHSDQIHRLLSKLLVVRPIAPGSTAHDCCSCSASTVLRPLRLLGAPTVYGEYQLAVYMMVLLTIAIAGVGSCRMKHLA